MTLVALVIHSPPCLPESSATVDFIPPLSCYGGPAILLCIRIGLQNNFPPWPLKHQPLSWTSQFLSLTLPRIEPHADTTLSSGTGYSKLGRCYMSRIEILYLGILESA